MNGHNPKRPTNDCHDVVSLLQELPRVAAPTDFNASLKARIAAAQAEANQFAEITDLIKELPRVTAPSDFDFKLRARIAQAKAEEQKASQGWVAALFGQSFTWVQAGAAMAAVAVVVSFVTFGVLRSEQEIVVPSSATNVEVASQNTVSPSREHETVAVEPKSAPRLPSATNGIANASLKPKTVRPAASLSNTGDRVREKEDLTPAFEKTDVVASKVMIKDQNGAARMVNLSEYNLGLQTAHLRPAQPRTAPPTIETAAMNIY